jgi:WD40 repeat protein
LASGSWDKTIKLWDVATGTQLRALEGHRNWVDSVAFSPDGKTLASGSLDETIKLWDAATGTQLRALEARSAGVRSVAFSPDGKTLASGSDDNTIKLWDVATGTQLHSLEGHRDSVNSVAFSPDSKTLASGSQDDSIKLWEVATGTQLRSLDGHRDPFHSVAFSPDGKTLVGGSFKTIKLWDVATGTQLRSLEGHRHNVNSVAFSPDGKTLVSGSDDNTIKLWDVATRTQLRSLKGHRYWVYSVAFSPNGKTLASGGDDNTIKLWDVATGTQLRFLKGHSDVVFSVAFSPDGKTLASGSLDKTIKLWNVATRTQLRSLEGHRNFVNSVAFSPDGKTLASGSGDDTIKLWDLKSGQELASLMSLDKTDWVVATPDGLFDGSPAAWSKMIWRFNNNTFNHAPVEAFFNEFYYPGLLTDILEGKHPKAPSDISQKDRRQPQLKLALTDAKPATALTARNVTVKIDIAQAPAGAQDIRLFRNGSLVKVWHGDVMKSQSSVTLEATIPIIAGENHLTAYAFNHDNIKSSDATLVVNGAESLKRQGTAYILAVGVNNYSNHDYDLKYAVPDAQEFSAEVKRRLEALKRYAQVEVISLADAEATKPNIMQKLTQLVTRVQPEDTVIVYFAGHGTAAQNRFYLIPHDLGYDGPRTRLNEAGLQAMLTHSISDIELDQAFEKIDAGQLLLVIDACNSGQALEAEEKRRGPMNSKGLAQLAYEKGMYVLTAAQSYQAAQEAAKFGHGFLTYALVDEGLKQGAADREPKDGSINLREWLNYATDEVPKMQEANLLEALRGRGRQLVFAGDGSVSKDTKSNVQRPRIFYRRELESNPLVVAILGTTPPQ